MMLWRDRHRRYLDQLSAYVDGALAPSQVEPLERHLEACAACRRRLEELRATVLALRELPQAPVPRSFALRPEQAAAPSAPAPASRAVPAFAFGLRLAGAGLAFALAAVLVVDLGGLAGDGGGDTTLQRLTEEAAPPAEYGDADQTGGAAPSPTETEDGFGVGGAVPTEVMGGGVGPPAEPPAASPEAGDVRIQSPLPSPSPEEAAAEKDKAAAALEATPSGRTGVEEEAADAGGPDALRAAEIGLAVALALAVAGGALLAFAGRRTRV